jgi:hypothetical protein
MDISDLTASTQQNAANGFSYDLSINIHRPFMFRLYPGFVIFAFWLIIIFELFLIFALSFFEFRKVSWQQSATRLFMLQANHRCILFIFTFGVLKLISQAEFANVAIFSALIFALPSFRNSMPLAPPFGSLSDWISFFWAESFAVIGLFIMGCKCGAFLRKLYCILLSRWQVLERAACFQKQRHTMAEGRVLRADPPQTRDSCRCGS